MNDWTERHNVHTLVLDRKHSLIIRVSWGNRIADWAKPLRQVGVFTVHALGQTLDQDFVNLHEAKKAGIELARTNSNPSSGYSESETERVRKRERVRHHVIPHQFSRS
jgi:hypothetical protein